MRPLLLALALAGCARGYGAWVSVEGSCVPGAQPIDIRVTFHPSEKQIERMATLDQLGHGSYAIGIVPPDGTSSIDVALAVVVGGRTVMASKSIPVAGSELTRYAIALDACGGDGGAPDGGAPDGNSPVDASGLDQAGADLAAFARKGDNDCAGMAGRPRCLVGAGQCVQCLAAGDCPNGQSCTANSCVAMVNCAKNADCATPPNTLCCTGVCLDPTSNAANCGVCGKNCTGLHSAQFCQNAQCRIASCAAGYADCDGVADDGCEAFLPGDIKNCGFCGDACAQKANTTGPQCSAGKCVLDCSPGWGDCDGQNDNGCETDLNSSALNCSQCGMACGNKQVCIKGVCMNQPACIPPSASCGMMGCPYNLDTDPNNCGSCGAICSANHVLMPMCSNGMCVGACWAGYADCNNNKLTDGCEANLMSDSGNCGMCGITCVMGKTCTNGQCQ